MCTPRTTPAALLLVALAGATVRAQEPRQPAVPQNPDPSFLEFLGGVDGLAEVNPDYLAQANVVHPLAPPVKPANPPPPPPPPPASVPGAKRDE
jgi:hypothetical protein